jgi:hypothetical protein
VNAPQAFTSPTAQMLGTLVRHWSSTVMKPFASVFTSAMFETEVVRVRAATDGEKETTALNAWLTGITVEEHGDSISIPFDRQALGV